MNSKNIFDFILLSALWGASYVFVPFTSGQVHPLFLAESRLVIAALCMGIATLVHVSWWPKFRLTRIQFQRMIVISLFNSVLPFAFFSYAMQHLGAGMGAILNSTSPIWTAIIGVFWLRQRLNPLRIFGLLLGFVGIIFLMWGKAHFTGSGTDYAILASIGITVSYGIATNYIKKYGGGIDPVAMALISMAMGSIMMAIPAIENIPHFPISTNAWLAMLALGIGSTGIAYFLFYRLIEQTGPSVAITVTFLVPVFGVLWGDLFLGEQITLQMVIGGSIVLLGTALATGVLRFKSSTKVA